jgi:hypothetical protein
MEDPVRRILTVVGALTCFLIAAAPSSLAAAATTPAERMKKAALGELREFRANVDQFAADAALSRPQVRSLERSFEAMRDAINANKSNLFARALLRLLTTISRLEDEGALPSGVSVSVLDLAADLTTNLMEIGFMPLDLGDGVDDIIRHGLAAGGAIIAGSDGV